MKKPIRRLTGDRFEDLALRYLQSKGLKLTRRNYRCRMGELDLIMQADDTLVFVEVRYRDNPAFGKAVASVDYHKQRKLILAAQHFLLNSPQLQALPCRFDVVGVERDANGILQLCWITDAFS